MSIGLEDWAYASRWDSAQVRKDCKGLPAKIAGAGQAAVFLVETSNNKIPSTDTLGCETNVLSFPMPVMMKAGSGGVAEKLSSGVFDRCNGHVPRNIRLSLSAIDMVQPYVCFSSSALTQQVVSKRKTSDSDRSSQAYGSGDSYFIEARWYIGGGKKVDATWLSWHIGPDIESFETKKSFDSNWTHILHALKNPSAVINREHGGSTHLRGATGRRQASERKTFENYSSFIFEGPSIWTANSPSSAGII